MKRMIAALVLAGCVTQVEDKPLTMELGNASEHVMTSMSLWEIGADGETIDDNLSNFGDPLPAQESRLVPLDIIRCFENMRVIAVYDDGHEATQDVNLCESQKVLFTY